MRYFVLFSQDGIAKASTLSELSKVLHFNNRKFEQLNTTLGDFNHLLGEEKELIGFEFPFALKSEIFSQSPLIRQSSNVRMSDGVVQFLLFSAEKFKSDEVLGIGNWVYHDGEGNCILVVPEITDWGKLWSKIAFQLETKNIPH